MSSVALLPLYLAMATDVTSQGGTIHGVAEKKVQWWRSHADRLPIWASAEQNVMLVQQSSATVERVFHFCMPPLATLKTVLWQTTSSVQSCCVIISDDLTVLLSLVHFMCVVLGLHSL